MELESVVLRRHRSWTCSDDTELNAIFEEELGPFAAMGEQKATQFFAHLAPCFEPDTAASYEALLAGWGRDVRERSGELTTSEVRSQETTLHPPDCY